MSATFKDYLIKVTHARDCKEVEIIQSLWSGYGKISRYQLIGSSIKTVVVKCIALDKAQAHPRGWNTDYGHQRKVKSYQVETHWYEHWNQNCTDKCKTPKYIGSFSEGNNQWIILEDLDEIYPFRKYHLSITAIKACLKWLANFHGTFLMEKPTGLWEVGTYWHLATRPNEFEKIEHQELKAKAHQIDEILNHCTFKTIVHGDAKLANFCFSETGTEVAAVDFQYVGGGCGMKDVAYFLGSCHHSEDLELHETELITYYFSVLREACTSKKFDLDDVEEEWRRLYPFVWADFTRFLLGWMPTHQKINTYSMKMIQQVLPNLQ
jgi:hypothetical protein